MKRVIHRLLTGLRQRRTHCAWCLQERHEKPRTGDSHGICRRHASEMLKALHAL